MLVQLTGLDRFVAASYGAHQQINRQVEETIVAYRRQERARLAQEMPAKAITLARDETLSGGLCLVSLEPKSNSIILTQAASEAQARLEQAQAHLPSTGDASTP